MSSGIVAVPYYGSLFRAKAGYERIYFIVEDGNVKERELNVRLGVWDSKIAMTLPEWLKKNGVQNLVCREEPEAGIKNSITSYGINILHGDNNNASRLMKSLLV